MNFRSLLIILYLNLNQNSEVLSERVIDLIRGTRRVLEYAPRTPRVSTSQQVASDDACAYELEAVRAAYCCTPRVIEASSLYIKDPKTAFFVVHFLLFSLVFCIVFHAEATPKSRYHTLAPRQVPRSRRSREARFPSRSSAREKFDFRGDLPDLLWITTPISRSVVRSSSDQVSVY